MSALDQVRAHLPAWGAQTVLRWGHPGVCPQSRTSPLTQVASTVPRSTVLSGAHKNVLISFKKNKGEKESVLTCNVNMFIFIPMRSIQHNF